MASDILAFDYGAIQGERLTSAIGSCPTINNDGSTSFEAIIIALESCYLLFSVNDDTDEVVCTKAIGSATSKSENADWISVEALRGSIGSEIGWLWLGKNSLGYTDMITLSFSGIEPSIALVGAASKLGLYYLKPAVYLS